MTFYTEPSGYEKTALSDLQGAWGNLRNSVVEAGPFQECKRILFHIDEAMSWESVRNLEQMKKGLLLIQNIAALSEVPDEVSEWIRIVRDALFEVFTAIEEGEAI